MKTASRIFFLLAGLTIVSFVSPANFINYIFPERFPGEKAVDLFLIHLVLLAVFSSFGYYFASESDKNNAVALQKSQPTSRWPFYLTVSGFLLPSLFIFLLYLSGADEGGHEGDMILLIFLSLSFLVGGALIILGMIIFFLQRRK